MQIQIGPAESMPYIAASELSSALKKYPAINHFVVTWYYSAFTYDSNSIASYNRQTRELKYRREDGDENKASKSYYVFTGVTEKIIHQAAKDYLEQSADDAFRNLARYGCVMKVGGKSEKSRDQNTK